MAMTKAEQQRFADLEKGLAMARAMRWPEYSMPAPMTRAEIEAAKVVGGRKHNGNEMVARGWFANSYTGTVSLGCSNGVHHSTSGDVTTSQQMGVMYSNEADAWRAVRYEMTERYAAALARIDNAIANSVAE